MATLADGGSPPSSSSENLSASQLRQRLAEIDDGIEELHVRLAELHATRESVISALQLVTYPVLTLPPEILAEIFIHCVDYVHIGRFSHSSEPILMLAGVCRTWREIAVNLPQIWSKIHISNSQSPSRTQRAKNLLEIWLQRAKNHELQLDVRFSASLADIFSALVPYSTQWQALGCNITQIASINDPPRLQGCLPLFRTLMLDVDNPDTPLPMVNAFSNAPLLRTVKLNGVTAQSVTLPWAQLTDLRLCRMKAAQAFQILLETPNLQILSLSAVDCMTFQSIHSSHVQLDWLHSLVFDQVYHSDLNFLDVLNLPALKSLDLRVKTAEGLWHLHGLLERSKCSLASLSLTNVELNMIPSILEHVPTITQLILRRLGWKSHGHLFTEIARLLPHLKKLEIETSPIGTADEEMAALILGNSDGHPDAGPTLEEFRFITPSTRLQEYVLSKEDRAAADRKLWAMVEHSRCEVNISGPRVLNIRSHSPRRTKLSYTLNNLRP